MLKRKYKIIEVSEDYNHSGYFIEETIYFWRWKLCVRFLADDEDEICPAFPTIIAAQEYIESLRRNLKKK